jgi:hypothetical protein
MASSNTPWRCEQRAGTSGTSLPGWGRTLLQIACEFVVGDMAKMQVQAQPHSAGNWGAFARVTQTQSLGDRGLQRQPRDCCSRKLPGCTWPWLFRPSLLHCRPPCRSPALWLSVLPAVNGAVDVTGASIPLQETGTTGHQPPQHHFGPGAGEARQGSIPQHCPHPRPCALSMWLKARLRTLEAWSHHRAPHPMDTSEPHVPFHGHLASEVCPGPASPRHVALSSGFPSELGDLGLCEGHRTVLCTLGAGVCTRFHQISCQGQLYRGAQSSRTQRCALPYVWSSENSTESRAPVRGRRRRSPGRCAGPVTRQQGRPASGRQCSRALVGMRAGQTPGRSPGDMDPQCP